MKTYLVYVTNDGKVHTKVERKQSDVDNLTVRCFTHKVLDFVGIDAKNRADALKIFKKLKEEQNG